MADVKVIAKRQIGHRVLVIRGQRVMLDIDLAGLYRVSTARMNEQVKRNASRFPEDFMFRLSSRERAEVIAAHPDLDRIKFSPVLPRAFTEHGTLMLASVLSSEIAVRVSIEIMRTFVRMREFVAEHRDLARRLDGLERKYDRQFKDVFDAIRELMAPEVGDARRIGFRAEEGA